MSRAPEEGEVTLVVRFQARSGREDELVTRLHDIVAASNREDGCLQYTLHRDERSPTCFVLYEQWRSRSALEAHDHTAHVRDFVAVLPELLVEPFGRWELRRLTTPAT